MDFVVARSLNGLYIVLDIAWLAVFATLLMIFKRRTAALVGLLAGVLYFIVDYGYFYRLLGSRVVTGAGTAPFLAWLSMSYGFTNFAWIWILLDRDERALEWSLVPIIGWVALGQLSDNFGAGFAQITISRGTGSYHGAMALILLVGYAIAIVHNLRGKERIPLLRLMAIGIGVQFAWEAALLINGIRPAAWQPIVINSLIETNLGMPYMYFIHKAVTERRRKKGLPG